MQLPNMTVKCDRKSNWHTKLLSFKQLLGYSVTCFRCSQIIIQSKEPRVSYRHSVNKLYKQFLGRPYLDLIACIFIFVLVLQKGDIGADRFK